MANRGAGEKQEEQEKRREEPGETPAGMAELVRIMREEQKQQQQLMQLQMDALRGMMERNVRAEEERDRQRVGAAAGVGEQILRLAPQLTGKAQQAYAAMTTADSVDYKKVKEAILRRYDVSEETYRQRFRAARRKEGEAYVELVTRLQDLVRKWMAECESVGAVLDKVVGEQLLNTMPSELRVWISERKPATSAEAGRLADDYTQARRHLRRSNTETGRSSGGPAVPETRKCHNCGTEGHLKRNCPVKEEPAELGGKNSPKIPKKFEKSGVKCYNCSKYGHISAQCPEKASLFCGGGIGRTVARTGLVEGVEVSDVLLDTGCTRTMVRSDLVPENKLLPGEAVTVRCAHGDTVLYQLADVEIKLEGLSLCVKAAVSDGLPVSVLLGTDVPELGQLLQINPMSTHTRGLDHALVLTRAQARRQDEEEKNQRVREIQSGVHPKYIMESKRDNERDTVELLGDEALGKGERGEEEQGEEEGLGDEEAGDGGCAEDEEDRESGGVEDGDEREVVGEKFPDELFQQPRERVRRTRKEKREKRRGVGLERAKDRRRKNRDTSDARSHLEISTEQLQHLQEEDETLARASEGENFFRHDGILYRRWLPQGQPEGSEINQIILPKQCRRSVLEIAHVVPIAGHLGKKKTAARIMRRFYWPTLFRDTADFCRSCPECQKAGQRRVPRAPLIPLPVMEEPFQRVAMDIIGPLPRSRSGHRYVLVLCDYATRYPEAVPMKTVDAEAVAEELVKIFSRVGLPREMLTDQGANFTSQLLAEIYRLLHIKALRTSPYHPQTDGLVERFNATLKGMLRKSATEDGKDWDRLLPYLLFAYREVPQESTGFSPFELLFGREVRGPLDVIKEEWEAASKSSESVVSHILLMRERLERMMTLAQGNLKNAQKQQKRWYDRTSRERTLKPGDRVLVLLPTSTSKLLAQWHGPYPVVSQVGRVNYVVDMVDRRKRKRVFHINMLKKWDEPESSGYLVTAAVDGEEEMETLTWNGGEHGEPTIGEKLTPGQRKELAKLLQKHQHTLTNIPGCTTIAEHSIDTGNSAPVRLPPYRLPHAYREPVKQELQEMREQGIIEEADSEWAAPIVVVQKKDRTIRLCVDYRRLNAVSRVDAYPIPRVDDLIDLLGQAQYLSTLDLTKGYWQVPISMSDQAKTAFTTPFGLFQFKRMPFGLQGAPASFQRMMDRLLQGLGGFASAYLDDLIIFSQTWREHLEHLEAVLTRLCEAGLTARPKKCHFGMEQCIYLGHVVGGGKVQVEASKVEAVQKMSTPKTKKDVRTFLGLTGYYRKFIPNYATIATPLTDLTRKTQPNKVDWTAECEMAFSKLKELLTTAPVLQTPDFSKMFIVQTDASERGVGAVLSQVGESGEDKPVAYFSKKLLTREENYSTVEKECLAIKLATQAFRVYLLGRPFVVQTDHRALEWLDRVKENNSRLSRWSLAMQPFQFTVEYRPGRGNANADSLSRLLERDMHVAGEGGRSVAD